MIPKYVVFLVSSKDNLARPIASGNSRADLLSVYHGSSYQLMPVGSWREEM